MKMQVSQVSVSDIIPTKDNKRTIDIKSQGFKDLLDSVKACGVQIPVHVRPHLDKKGKYDLRAGARRFKCCEILKLETIPALIIMEMSDEEAADLTFIENNFREDLPPLAQSEQISVSLSKHNNDVAAVAAIFGKPVSWVSMRAEVHKSLSQKWRKVVSNPANSEYRRWTIAHLALIARLPKEIQDDYYDRARPDDSVKEVEKDLSSYLMLLSKTQWKIDDETLLPKAGACSKCSKRTSCRPTLFEDESEEKIKKNDRCLDLKCWNSKVTAFVKRRAAELSKEHSNLVYVRDKYISDSNPLAKVFPKTYSQYDIEGVSKKDKKAVPALVVNGSGAGGLRWVRIGGHSGSSSRPKGKDGKPVKKSLAERRELLDAKRWAQVLKDLQEKLEKTPYTSITLFKEGDSFGLAFFMMRAANAFDFQLCDVEGNWKNVIAGEDEKTTLRKFWDNLKGVIDRRLEWSGAVTQTPKNKIAEAKQIAALIGVDIEAMFKAVSESKGFTEPKGWAAEIEASKAKLQKETADKKDKKPAPKSPTQKKQPKGEKGLF
jgi:ParB/RepB/Spo0J family partition protein